MFKCVLIDDMYLAKGYWKSCDGEEAFAVVFILHKEGSLSRLDEEIREELPTV